MTTKSGNDEDTRKSHRDREKQLEPEPNAITVEEESDRARIQKLFDKLDADRDGSISVKELGRLIRATGGPSLSRDAAHRQARTLIGGVDANRDSQMCLDEFVEFIRAQETQLKLSFRQLDRNNDSVITAEEIRETMAELGVRVSLDEAAHLLDKMDRDGNCQIDFDEWRDFLLFSENVGDVRAIFSYWKRANLYDIGENAALIPDDFTEEERQRGVVWKTLASGMVSGCVSRTSTAPLDRLKVARQARAASFGDSGASRGGGGLLHEFRAMIKEGGIACLWRGNGVNCVKIAPECALKFYSYDAYKRNLFGRGGAGREAGNAELPLHKKFVAGALAGATSQTLIYPMEVLKTRMCLRTTGQYSSMWDCARKLYAENGVRIFFRGYIPNVMGILPYAGIDLALFETFKSVYMRKTRRHNGHRASPAAPAAPAESQSAADNTETLDGEHDEQKEQNEQDEQDSSAPPVYVSLCAGAASSVCGQVASYPLALIRTTLQAHSKQTISEGTQLNMAGVTRTIFRQEGVRGFYRGMVPNMLKVIPAVSISYAVFDQMRSLLGLNS